MTFTVDDLAQAIRRVDGNHDKGAGALAEALMPFLEAALSAAPEPVQTVGTGLIDIVACGGCGGTDPIKRCIGCFHDFGDATSAWVRKIKEENYATLLATHTPAQAPVAYLQTNPTFGKELAFPERQQRLTDADRANGWDDIPLYAAPAPAIPAGWALVPEVLVTHLDRWEEACNIASTEAENNLDETYAEYWEENLKVIADVRAMLAARPTPPGTKGCDVRIAEVAKLAKNWATSRLRCVAMAATDIGYRDALNDLSEAEDALCRSAIRRDGDE